MKRTGRFDYKIGALTGRAAVCVLFGMSIAGAQERIQPVQTQPESGASPANAQADPSAGTRVDRDVTRPATSNYVPPAPPPAGQMAAPPSPGQPVTPVQAPLAAGQVPPGQPTGAVVIGEGDLLQVSLYGIPEFNQQVRVSAKGAITLPMIGELSVRGLSTSDAETLIASKLKAGNFFNDPQVNVLDKEFATQGISIMGEVQKPGVYPFLGPHKLFDVISAAGGATPRAGREVVISHRANPDHPESVILSNDPRRSLAGNLEIAPGDTVVVSKAGVVYVVGDVKLPGGFVLDKDKDLTVLQVIALAQGANSSASIDKTRLLRRTSDGVSETQIHLKKVLDGKAEDAKVQADDVIFVPHNAFKEFTKIGLTSAFQTAAGVAIYRF